METSKLKKFSQFARRNLMEQVASKLDYVLATDSEARRGNVRAVEKLEKSISKTSKEQVVERVAYIWFNRFCALRFMDVNRYSRIGVISPAEGQFQPEILAEAKMGHIDDEMVGDPVRQQIFALLDGKSPSRDPQGEAYRLLIVTVCNYWHKAMPFLFERIEDYTELLMPDDLLSGNSILAYTREAMTPDTCKDVEVIGWLYQFYISEKKDGVFAGLKKNVKITPENIPAATQLFTPHWIVRYLVENSLGRLWMLNHPQSNLTDKMDYYIAPVEPETDFLRIASPEEIKICDPACGSGHMLTYAFDLLYAIYEESGYNASDIPSLILRHNLYGIELDERAGELAAFALTMKAREKQRRFFRKPMQPNICVLENVTFEAQELEEYTKAVGRDLFTSELRETLEQFTEAKNFGSLIVPKLKDVAEVARVVAAQDFAGNLFLNDTHNRVQRVLHMAEYLSPKYHVVVANPPYMGGKGMNASLSGWIKESYPNSKADLFAAFIDRGLNFVRAHGYSAMVTMQSWMFLSSYENLRAELASTTSIKCLVHMSNMVMGIAFGTAATVWKKGGRGSEQGAYCYVDIKDMNKLGVPAQFPPENERNTLPHAKERLFWSSIDDLRKIPGNPIAYWVSDNVRNVFFQHDKFGDFATPAVGQNTGDNNRFLKEWSEVSQNKIGYHFSDLKDVAASGLKWFPYNKGGPFRKWYGNSFLVINWEDDGKEIKDYAVERNKGKHWSRYIQNLDKMLKSGVSWSATSSSYFGCRFTEEGFFFDVKGTSAISDLIKPTTMAAYLTTRMVSDFLGFLNPTIEFQTRDIRNLPFDEKLDSNLDLERVSERSIAITKSDWDAFETSWDFTTLPLLHPDTRQPTLAATYASLRARWQQMTDEMQRLEQENNRIFIDAYGLQDELTADVPLTEITLTCNPAYRYRGNDDLEGKLRADTMREFLSYAVGCMFGRYALEKEGLVLANQGETFEDYLARVPDPSFPADDDNVIPMLDGDWFTDDISDRFKQFLRLTFGDEQYEENLQFIEEAIGKDIRKYFLKDFYTDHWKRYKKRPIYWMFSSPKGSFNALIYMHRYRPDTVSVVLNDYLREFRTKLAAHKSNFEAVSISASASQGDKTKALKEIEKINSMITEMEEYEREILYPLATRQIAIDLDDGVKVNYPKFGKALKKITGLS